MVMENVSNNSEKISILLLSGSCCFPQLTVIDEKAETIVQQAIRETGVPAQVKTLLVSSALRGGIPMVLIKQIGIADNPSLIMRMPAIFIENKFVSLGIPDLDVLKGELEKLNNEKSIDKGNE